MTNHNDTIRSLKAALNSARLAREDYREALEALREPEEPTRPVDPEPEPEPEVRPPSRPTRPLPPPSDREPRLEPPATPDFPQSFQLTVSQGQNINESLRSFYKDNRVGADEWVGVTVEGEGHGGLNLGGKYQVHNDGKPLNVYVRARESGGAMIDGHKIEEYGGTFVAQIRKAKYERAAISDTGASGTVWYLDLRPLQNVEEAKASKNYEGGKWGFKPSDGHDTLVIRGTRYGRDEELGRPTRWFEHPVYETAARRIYVIDNQLKGGNRTPIQCNTPRAGTWPQVSPEVVVIRGNDCETGAQWDHNDGGAMIVWESNGIVVIEDNTIVSRYGGIKIGHQPVEAKQYDDWPVPHNFQVSPQGHVHREAVVRNNRVTITEGTRTAIGIDSCLKARVSGNVVDHQGGGPTYIVDGAFAYKGGAPKCAAVEHDGEGILTYDPVSKNYVPYEMPA
jgi:hypothetical protein